MKCYFMAEGKVTVGFATCGKSFLGKNYENVIDLESSYYKHINDGIENIPVEMRKGTKREINSNWSDNYYQAINEAIKKYDVVLVQLKPEHFDYFDRNNIKYSIAYPRIDDWETVEKRCIDRENNINFIHRLKEVFFSYYEDSLQRNYERFYIIDRDQTLEDCLIEDNIVLKVSR